MGTLNPDTIELGAATAFTGGGDLTKDVTGGTFKMTMSGVGGVSLLSCSGDASKSAECPIGLGHIKGGTATYGAFAFPQKAGPVTLPKIVSVDLPTGLPGFATKTITTLDVADSDGNQAFCAKITTAPKDTNAVQPIVDSEDSWRSALTDVSNAKCEGDGTLPGDGPFCYHVKWGGLGLQETIDMEIVRSAESAGFAEEKGLMSLQGTGVSSFNCKDLPITKNGQTCNPDPDKLKKCLPHGVTLEAANYCSNTDQVQVTIKDSNIKVLPSITGTASRVKCK